MKRIATGLQLSGPRAFLGKSKHERAVIMQIIRDRHLPVKKQEVIGDFIVMLGQMVKEPICEGDYVVFNPLTERQQIVKVYQDNNAWFVLVSGSTIRTWLSNFNQPYFRWVLIHPLDKEVLADIRRRKSIGEEEGKNKNLQPVQPA